MGNSIFQSIPRRRRVRTVPNETVLSQQIPVSTIPRGGVAGNLGIAASIGSGDSWHCCKTLPNAYTYWRWWWLCALCHVTCTLLVLPCNVRVCLVLVWHFRSLPSMRIAFSLRHIALPAGCKIIGRHTTSGPQGGVYVWRRTTTLCTHADSHLPFAASFLIT